MAVFLRNHGCLIHMLVSIKKTHICGCSAFPVPLFSPCTPTQKGCFYDNVKSKLTNKKLRQFLNLSMLPLTSIRDAKHYSYVQI